MNKKPHYKQSGAVFLLLGIVFLIEAFEVAFQTGWLFYCLLAVVAAVIVYAIISSVKTKKIKSAN